jgi:hypothetical protein
VEFAVAPKVDRRTKQGKEDWDLFTQESSHGKILLSDDQFAKVQQNG